ncbi:hypothetical protein HG531_009468 [Fusarium graminearum]|nr:hypothetical protein HG531_009468 [Fusarium graminearum]
MRIVLVCGKEQYSGSHVLILAGPSSRNLLGILLLGDEALLGLVATVGSHLRREDARSDAVDSDLELVADNLRGEHAGEVNSGTLGSVVGKVVLRLLDQTTDGADVYDGRAPALVLLTALLKKRQEGGGGKVHSSNICVVCLVPVLKGGILIVEKVLLHFLSGVGLNLERGARDTGVVDEDA